MKIITSRNAPKAHGSHLARAAERWGKDMPDWIVALARAADREFREGGTLTSLGKKLGLPGGNVSGLIGKTYPGNTARLEAIVRGQLMKAVVACPVLHMEIGRDACAGYQKRKFSAANPQLARLVKACPSCPHAIGGKE